MSKDKQTEDPKKKNFDYKDFFGDDLARDIRYGHSLTKYGKILQMYFDEGLLKPENAILGNIFSFFFFSSSCSRVVSCLLAVCIFDVGLVGVCL